MALRNWGRLDTGTLSWVAALPLTVALDELTPPLSARVPISRGVSRFQDTGNSKYSWCLVCGRHYSKNFHKVTARRMDSPDLYLLSSYPVWFNICPEQRCPSGIINYIVMLTLNTLTYVILTISYGESFYHYPHLQMRKLRHRKHVSKSLPLEVQNSGYKLQSLHSWLSILNFPWSRESVQMEDKCKEA